MNVEKYIKRVVRYLIKGVPEIHVMAKVISLSPNELLKGRTALITGGTSGIGYSIAKAYLESGATVVITGREVDRLNVACEQLRGGDLAFCDRIFGVVMDNTDVSSFAFVLDDILHKVEKVDVLVNNAGLVGGDISSVIEEQYDTIFDTNLKGMFFLSKLIGKHMKENSIKGNILNIASSSSLRPAISAYTLTKWGTRGLTLGLAKVLAPYGITVNGIAPGPTATPMLGKDANSDIIFSNPLGRFALPEEVANMAVILASDMGRSIIGDIVYMTGGSGLVTLDDVDYKF